MENTNQLLQIIARELIMLNYKESMKNVPECKEPQIQEMFYNKIKELEKIELK